MVGSGGIRIGARRACRGAVHPCCGLRQEGRGRGGRRRAQRAELSAGRRRLFQGHGQRRCAHAGRGPGPQHVAGVDRRQRPLLGRHGQADPGRLRPAEDRRAAAGQRHGPAAALVLAGPGQRAVLRWRAAGRRPSALRPQARHAARRLPARSVRQCAEISRREDRRARHDVQGRLEFSGRLLFRRADRHHGPAPVHQSRFRRRSEGEVGREALLLRSRLLQRPQPHQAVSRRHVLRLLPRRAEPDQSAGRSLQPAVRQPQLDGRRAIYVGGPAVPGRAQQGQLHVPAGADLSPRRDGHLAGLHRQHQQPAHHERGLQPEGAAWRWPSASATRS